MLIGGLGLGFTLQRVLADPRVEKVAVVEIEEALIRWMRDGTVPHGPEILADQRVRIVNADIAMAVAEASSRFDLVLLDVDNGPGYLVHDANAGLYEEDFLHGVPTGAEPGRSPGRLVRQSVTRAGRVADHGVRQRRRDRPSGRSPGT